MAAPGSVYRTEVDSFVTITALGKADNIETFVLLTPSGRKFIFGRYANSTDGYQSAFDEDLQTLNREACTYALKRVEDSAGNYIDLSYTHAGFGEWLLTHIVYAGAPGIPAPFDIEFVYKQKENSPPHYRGLLRSDTNHFLDSIQINSTAEHLTVAEYQLEYLAQIFGEKLRLTAVETQLSADVGQPLQSLIPMKFRWSGHEIGAANVQNFPPTNNLITQAQEDHLFVAGDFDGDGRTDYLDARGGFKFFPSTNAGISTVSKSWLNDSALQAEMGPAGPREVFVGDFNGDGKADLLMLGKDSPLYIAISTGSSFQPWPSVNLSNCLGVPRIAGLSPAVQNRFDPECSLAAGRLSIGDFNGDGRDDILIHGFDGRLFLYLSTGSAFKLTAISDPESIACTTIASSIPANLSGNKITITPFPCDFNSDGNSDYVWAETQQNLPSLAHEDGLTERNTLTHRLKYVLTLPNGKLAPAITLFEQIDAEIPSKPLRLPEFCVVTGDFNGDGLPDFLVSDRSPVNRAPGWTMFLSRGPTTRVPLRRENTVTTIKNSLPFNFKLEGGETLSESLPSITASEQFASASLNPEPLHNKETTFPQRSARSPNVFAIDLNNDGLDDFVWYLTTDQEHKTENAPAAPGWWVCYSKGDGTFSPPKALDGSPWTGLTKIIEADRTVRRTQGKTEKLKPFYRLTRTADHNGDGLLDWVLEVSDDGFHYDIIGTADLIKNNQCPFPDLVTDITNGLGSRMSINYMAAKDDAVYTPGATVEYPILDRRSTNPVVSEIWNDSGDKTPAGFSYQYSGNHLDFSGRGSIGFNGFTTLDHQTSFLKYQLLAHSFPMTGLALREQTYRFWNDGEKRYLKVISSEDNWVSFDLLRDQFSSGLFGTLHPFISHSTKLHALNNDNPDFIFRKNYYPSHSGLDQFLPAHPRSSLVGRVISDFWLDNQSLYARPPQTASLSNLPGEITNGNVTRSNIDNDRGNFNRTATLYYQPSTPDDILTDLRKATITVERADNKAPVMTATKTFVYLPKTNIIQSEVVDGRNATNNDAHNLVETTYDFDPHARLTAKFIHKITFEGDSGSASETTALRRSAYDDRVDEARTEVDENGQTAVFEYNQIFQTLKRSRYSNGHIETRNYDPLGREISVVNDTTGYKKNVEYAWTTPINIDWKKVQIVGPPTNAPGQIQMSTYAERTSEVGKKTVTTYYDRISRVIRTIEENGKGLEIFVDIIYNELGQEVAVSKPYRHRDTAKWDIKSYDAYGNVSREYSLDKL